MIGWFDLQLPQSWRMNLTLRTFVEKQKIPQNLDFFLKHCPNQLKLVLFAFQIELAV